MYNVQNMTSFHRRKLRHPGLTCPMRGWYPERDSWASFFSWGGGDERDLEPHCLSAEFVPLVMENLDRRGLDILGDCLW